MQSDERPVGLELFCGAGGMSLGFERAGINVVAAVDVDPIHVHVHDVNFPSCKAVEADLAQLTGDDVRARAGLDDRHIDVVFGGPPCQGFSLIGRRQIDDPRNQLTLHFARLVTDLSPSYFVMENVEGLLMGDARVVLREFVARVKGAGYCVVDPVHVLDAADFGVPQYRRRAIILGYRQHMPPLVYPDRTHGDNRLPRTNVWDAISDLPNVDEIPGLEVTDIYTGKLGRPSGYARRMRGLEADQCDGSQPPLRLSLGLSGCARTEHTVEVRERFARTEFGKYEPVSRFYRLDKKGLSPTLRAGTDSTRGSYMAPRPIHPVQPRVITVREAARLHSFPDWFQFHQTKWHSFRQIGNSVPPLLAQAVATQVRDAIRHGSRVQLSREEVG